LQLLVESGGQAEIAVSEGPMSRTLRLAGVQIALVAMLLRALLPVGWMPGSADNSSSPFVICTVNGPVHAAHLPDAGKHQPGHDDSRQNDVCPFAASIHLATPAAEAAVASATQVASSAPDQIVAQRIHDIARYALQSPRAPPSFV
jgi:hypothetical protein